MMFDKNMFIMDMYHERSQAITKRVRIREVLESFTVCQSVAMN